MKNRLYLLVVAALLIGCETSPEKVKLRRYFVAGERLYADLCANCHQDQGQGLLKMYPPINRPISEEDVNKIACTIKLGANDSITVNGIRYTLPMPDLHLSDLEIAEITTYISNSWGNELGLIDVNTVRSLTRDCD